MVFGRILSKYANRFSIDLGTAYTVIYKKGKGIVLNQPSVVALKHDVRKNQKYVCAIGDAAKNMLGKTPQYIEAIRPLRNGVIADFNITEAMLQHFIHSVNRDGFMALAPEIIICVPCGSTQVERRAIKESAMGAGARNVYLIDEPMAAAIGAGLPVEAAHGSMVVDIGGGTTEVAIISLNGIVHAQSALVGGDRFDEAIINYVRRNYSCLIGEATAEKIKKTIATAFPSSEVKEMQISGRHVVEGVPRSIVVNSNDMLEALQDPLSSMLDAIRNSLEASPPELAADIEEKGIVLTGGGALLNGLDQLISEETRLPVFVAEDPLTCVARGGGEVLEKLTPENLEFLSSE
tara:strand:- start:1094 stop:2140 length:1047 start_codon:yes stop_codon:yes gene_type:complete